MIIVQPIGIVRNSRSDMRDDNWGGLVSTIELLPPLDSEALVGLDAFSHVEVLFHFHAADPGKIVAGARHPRNNVQWPRVGILAQRAKNRPNHLGSTIVRLLAVRGATLEVAELDAIEGTPVLDIKPVMREFLPRGEVVQPAWASELMGRYWEVPT